MSCFVHIEIKIQAVVYIKWCHQIMHLFIIWWDEMFGLTLGHCDVFLWFVNYNNVSLYCLLWICLVIFKCTRLLFFQMTSGMVISTFLSAPIMYVSAWLLTIPWMDPKPLESALKNISFNISIVSFVALVSSLLIHKVHTVHFFAPFVSPLLSFLFLLQAKLTLWFWVVVEDLIKIA